MQNRYTVAGRDVYSVGCLSSVTIRNDLQNRYTVAGRSFYSVGCLSSVTVRNDLQNRYTANLKLKYFQYADLFKLICDL
ncbi:MAG: hypothetical protein GY795_13480 [Desulfobacterales bacterium]|nr:hypothetical protein [Desulfobacterales bacterium]